MLQLLRRGSVWMSTGTVLAVMFGGCRSSAQDAAPQSPVAADASQADIQSAQQWPMRINASQGQITVYQPQVTKFDGNQLSARAAVSVVTPGQTEPVFGAIWMQSRVDTDRAAGIVRILDVTVTRVRFPEDNGITAQTMTDALRSTMPQEPMTLSLDQLTSMLEVIQKEKAAVKDLDTTPPNIIFRDQPAVLVQYDGAPRLVQEPNSSVYRAVNTPFFVALQPPTKTYYLKGAGLWFASPDPLGPFKQTAQVPAGIKAAADADGYQDPQQPLPADQAARLEIVTATEPTELIWTDGPEEMGTVANTDLLYVTNTDSDVFLEIQTQRIFVLLSGRWYVASNRSGPWTYVAPDQLPADFKLIPPDSQKGNVLANVAGTQTAKDAVADTFVPQTAAIDRSSFDQPTVQYDGDPNFAPIEGTTLSYAVNTPNSVLLVSGQYYCCSNAVWYVSPRPIGPWNLCTVVPTVIYTIPPSCPIYSVRYCYVYEVTPRYVYCGYTPGYVGCYPYHGVVVYGTGYRYKPWVGRAYYPRPYTYGFSAQYNITSNNWGFTVGFATGGGSGWFGHHSRPTSRGQWFGHGGYRSAEIHNTTINIHQTVINRPMDRVQQQNIYARRKDVRQNTPPVYPGSNQTGRSHAQQPVAGHSGNVPGANEPRANRPRNNVFVDSNGNVYRKTLDGWDERRNNKWVPSNVTPANVTPKSGGAKANRGGQNGHGKVAPNEPKVGEPGGHKHAVNSASGEVGPVQPGHVTPHEPNPAQPGEPTHARSNDQHRGQPNAPKQEQPNEPKQARPSAPRQPQQPDSTDHQLNQEYRARVEGDQRTRNAPREPSPAPDQVPTGNDNGGNRGQRGGGGGGSQ